MEKDLNDIAFEITIFLSKLHDLQSEINNRCIAMLDKFDNEIEADEELKQKKRQIIGLQQRALMEHQIVDSLYQHYVDVYKKHINKN